MSRLAYWRRILAAYALGGRSQLSFWHERPELNGRTRPTELGAYWQVFHEKSDYTGPFDDQGIPMLDYRGRLGRQYNPIAIAQYGLGNFNRYHSDGENPARLRTAIRIADWLVDHLETTDDGFAVWNHHFDWEYRSPLKAPWFSALAQGQGISLLVRVQPHAASPKYLEAARKAFEVFLHPVDKGGVAFYDDQGRTWLEEYIVSPPTHILNGFMWAAWGLYDLWLATGDPEPKRVFDASVRTLRETLSTYDTGFWSLYEHSGTRLRMIASPFYHRLHVVQLRVMHRLTGEKVFGETADRWEAYTRSAWKRGRAWVQKAVFKVFYY
ncbi:MAG TPA: D-glucuronyl C5-epimerase family protein [Planctomycetota bacterium]|nr:D-glucuronyl C5-epimerase family protein [Planctomycetota bacterium]